MIGISKINVGSISKKSKFDFSHDVNTTSDFGFCQPSLFREIVADTHVSLETRSYVRLGVLQVPSYANIKLHTYTSFIPMTQVFEAYSNMRSQLPYTSSLRNNSSYPVCTDYLTAGGFLSLLFSAGWYGYKEQIQDPLRGSIFRALFIPVLWDASVDPSDDSKTILIPLDGISSENDMPQNPFLTGAAFANASDSYSSFNVGLRVGYQHAIGHSSDLDDSFYRIPTPSISNADFVFKVVSGKGKVLTFHATYLGRNILKILNGMQYTFPFPAKKLPLTPLFAYYKGWYDIFNPGRESNFMETSCYKMIHRYYDYPTEVLSLFESDEISGNPSPTGTPDWMYTFEKFLFNLADCYYSLPVDPFTVCMNSLSQGADVSNFTYLENSETNQAELGTVWTSPGTTPSHDNSDSSYLNSMTVKVLQRALPYINRNSIIGRKIEDWMRVVLNESMPTSTCLSHDSYNVNIDPVFSTNESDSVSLGEYAGKGTGNGGTNLLKRDFKKAGFLIQYTVIVPVSGYSQGFGTSLHVDNDEFYNAINDSLGMEAVSQSAIFGERKVFDGSNLIDSTFGFRPRLMDYKYQTNVRSGDFNRLGYSSQLMPYCLDRYFTPPSYSLDGAGSVAYINGVSELVSESLRYIGNNPNYGNFNRIFTDTRGFYDDFIVHIHHIFNVSQPVKPVADSFDTYDPETNNDVKQVEHA